MGRESSQRPGGRWSRLAWTRGYGSTWTTGWKSVPVLGSAGGRAAVDHGHAASSDVMSEARPASSSAALGMPGSAAFALRCQSSASTTRAALRDRLQVRAARPRREPRGREPPRDESAGEHPDAQDADDGHHRPRAARLLVDLRPAQRPTARAITRAKPLEASSEPPRYDDAQLGTLRERQSRLACECPNHVAEVVSSLVAFERYSRACANRDDDDARMHQRLASSTASAWRVMEDALTELLKFENIAV
jgi:hypothetical protein